MVEIWGSWGGFSRISEVEFNWEVVDIRYLDKDKK